METMNFNTVNQLSEMNCENRQSEFVGLAKSFAEQAIEIKVNNEGNFMLRMACQEVINSWRKSESADCEYSAYAAAHSAEKWLEKMITRKF
jgi:hypothetical protein